MADFNRNKYSGTILFENLINSPSLELFILFNEQSGSIIYDRSDNRYDGDVDGTLNFSQALGNFYGVQFPALNTGSIDLGNVPNLRFEYNEPFSGIAVVRIDVTPTIENALEGGRGWEWYFTEARKPGLILQHDSSKSLRVEASTALTLSTLTMIGFSYNGNGLASGITFYNGGVADTKTTESDSLASSTILTAADVDCIIAPRPALEYTHVWNIGLLAIWNRELNVREHKRFAYQAGLLA